MRLGDRAQRQHRSAAGIGVENIDPARLVADPFVEPVEILGIGRIRPDGGDVAADLGFGRLERVETPAGDEDVCAFRGEHFGGGEADPAGATRDDGNLAVEPIRHSISPS
jgi:hypothetical protein